MRILRYFLLSLCLLATPPLFAADQPASPVNINTADVVTLSEALTGVGPSKAEAIVAYRQSFGPFQSVDELTAVKGIGNSLLDKNRDRIILK